MESLKGALASFIPWLEGSRSLVEVEESWETLELGFEESCRRG